MRFVVEGKIMYFILVELNRRLAIERGIVIFITGNCLEQKIL